MSKIEELILKLCPDGVEYKKFGEVATYVRGVTYNKNQEIKDLSINGIKLLRANNITLELNAINFQDVKVISEDVKIKKEQFLKKNDILICAGSGSRQHIGKVAYIDSDMDYTFGGFMAVIRCGKKLLPRYMFNLLKGYDFDDYLNKALNSTTINNLNASIMNEFSFPVPPIEVQQEIVRILDKFSSLSEKLNEELELRKKQYEYYREKTISSTKKYESRKLSDLCKIQRGVRVVKKQLEKVGQYPVFQNSLEPLGYYNQSNVSANTSFMICAGAAGNVGFSYDDFWAADDCFCFIPFDNLNDKYLFYVLKENQRYFESKVRKAGVPRLSRNSIENFEMELPPLAEQERIVSILDKFDTLVNDQEKGLPAEIRMVQKQYEYYREKLLTF